MKWLPFLAKNIDILAKIIDILKPPRLFSWQTIVLLSIFVWLTGFFAVGYSQSVIAFLSWLLLIIGAGWFTAENPLKVGIFSVSAWITGAFICIFIFGSWNEQMPRTAFVIWPIISGAIAILPELVKASGKIKIPPPNVRQNLVIILAIHLLISCWIQFHFYIQTWLKKYPSLLADDFSQSAFVVKLPTIVAPNSKGIEILQAIELRIKKEIDNKPWPFVQQWLNNAKPKIDSIAKEELKKNTTPEESVVWKFDTAVLPAKSQYNLKIIAKWQGLGSQSEGYNLEKSCQIAPIQQQPVRRLGSADSSTSSPVTVSFVQCSDIKKQENPKSKI